LPVGEMEGIKSIDAGKTRGMQGGVHTEGLLKGKRVSDKGNVRKREAKKTGVTRKQLGRISLGKRIKKEKRFILATKARGGEEHLTGGRSCSGAGFIKRRIEGNNDEGRRVNSGGEKGRVWGEKRLGPQLKLPNFLGIF